MDRDMAGRLNVRSYAKGDKVLVRIGGSVMPTEIVDRSPAGRAFKVYVGTLKVWVAADDVLDYLPTGSEEITP